MKKNIFKLSKPFTFEGETYTELNLAALEDITGQQLYNAERIYVKKGGVTVAMEYNLDFIFTLCSMALKKPIEFFYALPATDAYHLKYRITNFLEGGDIVEESDEP